MDGSVCDRFTGTTGISNSLRTSSTVRVGPVLLRQSVPAHDCDCDEATRRLPASRSIPLARGFRDAREPTERPASGPNATMEAPQDRIGAFSAAVPE